MLRINQQLNPIQTIYPYSPPSGFEQKKKKKPQEKNTPFLRQKHNFSKKSTF